MHRKNSFRWSSELSLFWSLVIVAGTYAEAELPVASHQGSSQTRVSESGNWVPQKRAYSYVSEYKRLPVYNFGLGKRSVGDENIAENDYLSDSDSRKLAKYLEIARRESRGRPYNFGLGKRNEEYMTTDDEEDSLESINYLNQDKREKYQFGLGKRMPPRYEFGLGKRARYNFGLGKRQPMKSYSFGLGKRTPPYEGESIDIEGPPYDFSLGN